jgi:hypothetical protein
VTVLKVLGIVALLAGVTIEVFGLPLSGGIAGNLGAVLAVALWAPAAFSSRQQQPKNRR